jgi:hypothetical protein
MGKKSATPTEKPTKVKKAIKAPKEGKEAKPAKKVKAPKEAKIPKTVVKAPKVAKAKGPKGPELETKAHKKQVIYRHQGPFHRYIKTWVKSEYPNLRIHADAMGIFEGNVAF